MCFFDISFLHVVRKMKKEKEQRMFFNISHSLEQWDDNTSDMIIESYACVFNEHTLIGSEDYGFYNHRP